MPRPKPKTENELRELAMIQDAKARSVDTWIGFGKFLVLCIIALVATSMVLEGVRSMMVHDSSKIEGVAKIVESLKLGSIFGYVWGALASVACAFQAYGKKRAIREKSRYQRIAERNDSSRSSARLTETGGTDEN